MSAKFAEQFAATTLSRHLTAANLRTEAAHLASDPGFERPYGWMPQHGLAAYVVLALR